MDLEFKWNQNEKDAFEKIKATIIVSPSLCSPNFDQDFFLYNLASNYSLVVVLIDKDVEGTEYPHSFMSTNL